LVIRVSFEARAIADARLGCGDANRPCGVLGISWNPEVRGAMSDSQAHVPASCGATLERSREDVLDAARPLPSDEDVVIEDLSDDEDRLFLAAILDV
jgi:hypothetical protein